MTRYSVPSKDDMVDSVRVPLVGGEDYIVRILEIAGPTPKQGFGGKSTVVLTPKFEVVSFADGAPAEDKDGNLIGSGDPRWLWRDVEPGRYGFMTNGTPSIARQFFLAANGIRDINSAVPDGDTDELIGKTLVASVSVYTSGRDGQERNKIIAFKPLPRQRGQRSEPVIAPPVLEKVDPVNDEFTAMVAQLVESGELAEPAEE